MESASGEQEQAGSPSMDMQVTPPPPPPPRYDDGMKEYNSAPQKRFPTILIATLVVVVIASVAAILLSGGTEVKVTPVVTAVTVSGDFVATASSGELPYEVVSVEQVGAKEMKAEGTENANDPAQGPVTIYNAQAKPQELIKNTRFETPEGLIFRIRESITVPAGTAEKPGEYQTTVYADAGGESYNIGPSSFTLPGLKGSAIFDKVYARSSGSMTGGFSGERPSVTEATRSAQVPGIEEKLRTDLAEAVAAKVPEGYTILPGSIMYSFAPMPDAAGAGEMVKVQLQGSARAYAFPKSALAKAIASRTIGAYANQNVTLESVEGLTLSVADGAAPAASDALSFALSGNADIYWVIDPEKISGSVAGKTRDAARTLLAGYPEIAEASLVLRPFWEGKLPEDPSKIEVVIEKPEDK